jgi:hypothetical protein
MMQFRKMKNKSLKWLRKKKIEIFAWIYYKNICQKNEGLHVQMGGQIWVM